MLKTYHVFPQAVPIHKCSEIIDRGMSLLPHKATIGFNEDRLDNSYRVSNIGWFFEPDNKDLSELMMQYATFANREYFGFDISIGSHELQFTEYKGSENGKYDWHHDVFWRILDLTIVSYQQSYNSTTHPHIKVVGSNSDTLIILQNQKDSTNRGQCWYSLRSSNTA